MIMQLLLIKYLSKRPKLREKISNMLIIADIMGEEKTKPKDQEQQKIGFKLT